MKRGLIIIQKKSKPLLLSRGRCKQRLFFCLKKFNKPTPKGVGKLKNFLILIFLILIISSILAQMNDTITGKAVTGKITQSLGINVTVTAPGPALTIEKPKNYTYIENHSLLLEVSTNADSLWYNLDNGNNKTFTSNELTQGKAKFNTSEGSHTIYVFANNSDGVTSENVTFHINKSKFEVDYDEFLNDLKFNSTDFRIFSYSEIQNLSNNFFEHFEFGKIDFGGEIINITDVLNFGNNITNFTLYINLSSNRIEINSTALPNLNKSATLYLYNLTFTNPRIIRNGVVCSSSICTKISYSGGTLKFNVTGFSVYSGEETPVEASGTSGGGGGGGVTTKTGLKDFSIDKGKIKISLKQGETKKEEIKITNTGDTKINFNIEILGIEEFVKSSEGSFELEAGKSKNLFLDFTAREDITPNLYFGKLIVKSEGIKKEVLIILEVESKKPIFDIELKIPEQFKTILPGEEMTAKVELFNLLGGTAEKLDVLVEYFIKDINNNTIFQDSETVAVTTRTALIKEIKIPENAKFGNYILYVRVNYNSQVASATEEFKVGKILLSYYNLLLYITTIIILTSIVSIIYQIRKINKHLRHYHKINERDLLVRGYIKIRKKPEVIFSKALNR